MSHKPDLSNLVIATAKEKAGHQRVEGIIFEKVPSVLEMKSTTRVEMQGIAPSMETLGQIINSVGYDRDLFADLDEFNKKYGLKQTIVTADDPVRYALERSMKRTIMNACWNIEKKFGGYERMTADQFKNEISLYKWDKLAKKQCRDIYGIYGVQSAKDNLLHYRIDLWKDWNSNTRRTSFGMTAWNRNKRK